jgi:4-amino-4-deoxy-L-arabinose transferase-like glycosyltransferase
LQTPSLSEYKGGSAESGQLLHAMGRDDVENRAAEKRRVMLTAAVLGLTALLLYAPLIWWGIPRANTADRTKTFATDEILPLEGLAEMRNTFVFSRSDRNYGYPWWHYFVVSVAQAPYIAYEKLSGGFQKPGPDFPYGFRDPESALRALTLFGRAVSVLMGAGIVIAAYFFASALWGHLTGTLAAVLTMLNYLMFYYSRTGNPDVPAFFWISIGMAVYARILADGLTTRRTAWLGIFAGLAMATKDQAVIFFLPLGIALLFRPFRPAGGFRWRPYLAGLAASVLAYSMATGMWVDPRRHITHVYSLFFKADNLQSQTFYRALYPKTFAASIALTVEFCQRITAIMTPLVIIAALIGAVLVLKKSPRLLVLLLPIPCLYLALPLPTRLVVVRYFLPLTLLVDAFAAFALMNLRSSRLRLFFIPALVILYGWRLLLGVDLSYAEYNDPRYPAAQWLEAHARSGDTTEYFGAREVMPPLPVTIPSRRIAGRVDWERDRGHGPRILAYLATKGPAYIAIIPDVTSENWMERSGDCPPEVFQALLNGSTPYSLAAYFPSPSILPAWLRRPHLDNASLAPPVRIFARNDIVAREAGRL